MRVTVYSGPRCVVCTTVKGKLDKIGVEYSSEMISDHPEILEEAKAKGLLSLPVVTVEHDGETDIWAGPNLDEIRKLKTLVQA